MGIYNIEKACLVKKWPHLSTPGVFIQSLKRVSRVKAHEHVTFPSKRKVKDYSKTGRMSQRTTHMKMFTSEHFISVCSPSLNGGHMTTGNGGKQAFSSLQYKLA